MFNALANVTKTYILINNLLLLGPTYFLMAQERLIDLNLLRPFVGDDKTKQRQLLLAFEKELRAFLESMADAEVNKNLEAVRKSFHRISPSLKMLYQQQLINLAENYKQLLLTPETDDSDLAVHQQLIGTHTAELLLEIKTYL